MTFEKLRQVKEIIIQVVVHPITPISKNKVKNRFK